MNTSRSVWILITVVALVSALLPIMPASAQETFTLVFPAGQACQFDLQVDYDLAGGGPQYSHEFQDKDGNVVGTLLAGVGYPIVYTNLATGATMSTKANGAVSQNLYNSDGSVTLVMIGHTVVIMYPTDVPGPSATLYVGHVVVSIDSAGVWTLLEVNGKSTDICAALSK